MHQLELFTDKKLGFKYRKRLYNDNQNYMYTAIPTEQGYKRRRDLRDENELGQLELF